VGAVQPHGVEQVHDQRVGEAAQPLQAVERRRQRVAEAAAGPVQQQAAESPSRATSPAQLVPLLEAPWTSTTAGPWPTSWTLTVRPVRSSRARRSVGVTPTDAHSCRSASR
jgi:hypothetical protein